MPFPTSISCNQSHAANGSGRRRGLKPGGGVQVDAWSFGRKPAHVDGIVNWHDSKFGQQLPEVGGNAFRVDDRHRASRGEQAQQMAHAPAATDVIVNVPDQWSSFRPGPGAQQMHFETIGVNNVRLDLTQSARQCQGVARGRNCPPKQGPQRGKTAARDPPGERAPLQQQNLKQPRDRARFVSTRRLRQPAAKAPTPAEPPAPRRAIPEGWFPPRPTSRKGSDKRFAHYCLPDGTARVGQHRKDPLAKMKNRPARPLLSCPART